MSKRLENRVALITGGTTGIGLATAKLFAAEGARVIVTGRNPETLEAAKRELGGRAEVVESDAGDETKIAQLFAELARTYRRLDVLFLNAGIARFAPLAEAAPADFDAMWRVSVRDSWLALKHALPLLSEGASVIVNSSVAGQKGLPGSAAYAATKAALRGLIRAAAAELAGRKVRVNAVSPGPVETPIFGKLGLPPKAVDELAQDIASRVPLGRIGSADEIAAAALFLASASASFMTGSEISVDGGFAQV
jgi:NAD(P)-dependent dehydrogenase (short-subunit alcohol dehydrogenase family)